MKRLFAALLGIAAVVGLTAAAVYAFDDRELFVPPPDAVAEGFYREVVTKRWSRAQTYLLEPVEEEQLRHLEEQLSGRLGEVTKIDSRTGSRDSEWANVFVTLESARGAVEVGTVVRWNGDEWKVSR